MAAEYLANAVQAVSLHAPVIFTASIPCRKGYVYHEDETGVFILRGITNQCFATYQVTFNGNIAIPTGGTVGSIAVAITINGEPRLTSRAIITPAAVDEYGNVRRDSMGRYSRDEANEEIINRLHEVMNDAPNEQTKQEIRKLINKMENM